jgi:hypothetical protein
MAKDSPGKSTTAPRDQPKKMAKKEAKAMLVIEQVKASLEKAQGKLAKAQARVEARSTRLHALEAKLAEVRSTSPSTPVEAPDSGFDHQQGQPDPQELPTGAMEPSTSSPDAENHASIAHTQSETTMATSTPETANPVAVTPPQAPATGIAAPAEKAVAKPRTPSASAPRRSPAKPSTSAAQSSSSTPTKRATTPKPASKAKTTPEASDSNASE